LEKNLDVKTKPFNPINSWKGSLNPEKDDIIIESNSVTKKGTLGLVSSTKDTKFEIYRVGDHGEKTQVKFLDIGENATGAKTYWGLKKDGLLEKTGKGKNTLSDNEGVNLVLPKGNYKAHVSNPDSSESEITITVE